MLEAVLFQFGALELSVLLATEPILSYSFFSDLPLLFAPRTFGSLLFSECAIALFGTAKLSLYENDTT